MAVFVSVVVLGSAPCAPYRTDWTPGEGSQCRVYLGGTLMNRSTLIGVVAGIGIAMAGGVAAYTFLGMDTEIAKQGDTASMPARAGEECWDQEVTVQTDPTDAHRIAGTAGGAVIGGAIGKDVGDRDITTAAGAAVGAVIGRRIQEEIQENRAGRRTTTTIERRCAPVGSR